MRLYKRISCAAKQTRAIASRDATCTGIVVSKKPVARMCPGKVPIPLTTPPTVTVKRHNWFATWRFRMALLLCFGTASMHTMNINLSLAIICMLNDTAIHPEYYISYTNQSGDIMSDQWSNSTRMRTSACQSKHPLPMDTAFSGSVIWTSRTQGLVFAAFSWGILTIIATGWLADKLNSKYLMAGSVLVAAGASIITPYAAVATSSAIYVILLRTVIGVADATMQPAMSSLMTRWFPSSERNTAMSIATGGRQLGTLLILPISGHLCLQTQLGGWNSIFYLSGFMGVLWCTLWMFLAADKPGKHSRISLAERKKIELALQNEKMHVKRRIMKVPWRQLLSSSAVWASVVSVICHEYPVKTLVTFLPTYFQDVLRFSVKNNGFFSIIPTVSFFVFKLTSSTIADIIQRKLKVSKTTVAKIMNSVASLGLGGFLIGASFLGCSCPWLAVAFLSLSLAFAGLHTPGCIGSLVSIAPRYSGSITGIAYELAASSAIVNAIITKEIVVDGTRQEWSIVFYIAAVVAFLPLFVFNVWGSATVQSWAINDGNAPNTQVCVLESSNVKVKPEDQKDAYVCRF